MEIRWKLFFFLSNETFSKVNFGNYPNKLIELTFVLHREPKGPKMLFPPKAVAARDLADEEEERAALEVPGAGGVAVQAYSVG